MLGAEIEMYKGNKIVMGLVLILCLGAAAVVSAAFTTNPPDNDFRIFALPLLVVPVFLFAWLNSIRVALHGNGISYSTLFGEKEMRWHMVQRFGYEAIKRSINFIPIGTYYLYRLRDTEGKKIRVGNRVEHPAKLGEKLTELTTPVLLRKTVDRYNSGEELDFGAIKVSRTAGIKIKKLFGYKEIPWGQVSSFAIQRGEFYIWRVGEKRTTGWGLHHVFNAFALLALLQSICKPSNEATG